MTAPLSARRDLLVLLTLAGIQFTHIVDIMVMMPLGPHVSGYQRGRSVASVLSVLLVNKLFLYGAVSAPSISPDAAKVS